MGGINLAQLGSLRDSVAGTSSAPVLRFPHRRDWTSQKDVSYIDTDRKRVESASDNSGGRKRI